MFWKKEVNSHNYSLKQEKHMQCYLFIIIIISIYFFAVKIKLNIVLSVCISPL